MPCLFLLHMQQSTVLASFLFPTNSPVHSSCFIRVYHFHILFLQPCARYPCFSLFTRWWWRRLVYFHSILKFSLIFSPSHSYLQTVHFLFALFSLELLPCWDGHLRLYTLLSPVWQPVLRSELVVSGHLILRLSLYPVLPSCPGTPGLLQAVLWVFGVYFPMYSSRSSSVPFSGTQKVWVLCGFTSALMIWMLLEFLGGRCMKSFRLIPIWYLTSKASGVTELRWGTKAEENWQETGCFKVLLPLSDHLDLVIFQVQGFKPLFLLQLSNLILGFDLFPLSLNPCFSNPLPTLLSLRWDPAMVFPFSSWTVICHTAQSFYPHTEPLFGFLSTGYPRWFHHFIPHSNKKETFSWLNVSSRVHSALACHTDLLLTCSWCTLSAPCPAQKTEG